MFLLPMARGRLPILRKCSGGLRTTTVRPIIVRLTTIVHLNTVRHAGAAAGFAGGVTVAAFAGGDRR